MDDLKEKLKQIAELTRNDVGRSEENVKQKIVVPLLECLGHNRNQLDFEYGSSGKRIDIFIKDIPKDCKVIIDTKNYDEDLGNHLEQIGLYAFQERAKLALIINGEEIRIYCPFFKEADSFKDTLLYSIKRIELTKDSVADILYNMLSKDTLKNRKVKDFIEKREHEIIDVKSRIDKIKESYEKKKMELSYKKEDFDKKLDEIQDSIKSLQEQISKIESEMNNEANQILKSANLPENNNEEVIVFRKNINKESSDRMEAEVQDFVNNKSVKAGQRIYRNYKGKVFEAEFLSDGKIKFLKDGKICDSPSMAANYITNNSVNGWIWWKYKDEYGHEHILDELRRTK